MLTLLRVASLVLQSRKTIEQGNDASLLLRGAGGFGAALLEQVKKCNANLSVVHDGFTPT